MKLEDFKLQKGDKLDTLSKKYISVTKGGNKRELYSIINGSYICTEYLKPENDKRGKSNNRVAKRYELVKELENYLIYKYNKTYYIYSLITNILKAKCDYYETNIRTRKIKIFDRNNMNGEARQIIDFGKKGESEFAQLNIEIGNFTLKAGLSTLIYYGSIVIIQEYSFNECYMKDGTFVGNAGNAVENVPFIVTEKIVALLNNNKWRIYDIANGNDKYNLEFNIVKLFNNCIVAYDTNRNKIIIFDLNGEEIHIIKSVYNFSWKTCTDLKSSIDKKMSFLEFETEKKVYFFDTINLKKYVLNGKVEGKLFVSGLKEKWYYIVRNENKIGLIELSEIKGLKKIMPVKYESIYNLDDFLYGEDDDFKDIYDLTGRLIALVIK